MEKCGLVLGCGMLFPFTLPAESLLCGMAYSGAWLKICRFDEEEEDA